MAIANLMNVPPELQQGFKDIVRSTKISETDTMIMATQPGRLDLTEPQRQHHWARYANAVTTWLEALWIDPRKKATAEQFRFELKEQLLAGNLSPEFFSTLSPTQTQAGIATPVVMAFSGETDHRFYDPDRLPTQSTWPDSVLFYNVPGAFPTSGEYPSPGFRGEVINGYFRDLYCSQPHYWFQLPTPLTLNTLPPIAVTVSATIMAFSSFRGNRAWFTLWPLSECLNETDQPFQDRILSWYPHQHLFCDEMPGEELIGWEYSVTRTLKFWLNPTLRNHSEAPWTRIHLILAIPPTRGHLFSNNDFVQVFYDATPTLHLPKGP